MSPKFEGNTVSEMLPGIAAFVLEHGDETGSRNGRVTEILNATIEIEEPYMREILTVGRKANVFAQIAETMWVLSGRNDIDWLSDYLPRAVDYSDDGDTWRGGYGPRIRGGHGWGDQLAYVVDTLKADPLSRQAVIAIYDPARDMEPGKDRPCNDFLQFQSRLGKLHLTVTVRSNDLFWGWSGINVFEWSTLQEIVASLLGVEVGPLVFNIGNLHIYEKHRGRASRFSYDAIKYEHFRFNPDRELTELSQVDSLIEDWFGWEDWCRKGLARPEMLQALTEEPLFHSWAAAIAYYWTRELEYLELLEGTTLGAAIAKTPLSVYPEPVRRSHRPAPGMGPGRGLKDRTRAFYGFVAELHATKHKSYGDSWKKRGEMLSILPNIARKVDRLGGDDKYESAADTVIDLWVYLAKYSKWLVGENDGPDGVNGLLRQGLQSLDIAYPGVPAEEDLESIRGLLNLYLDRAGQGSISRTEKLDCVSAVMPDVLRMAEHLWNRQQAVEPLETTDGYRGAWAD